MKFYISKHSLEFISDFDTFTFHKARRSSDDLCFVNESEYLREKRLNETTLEYMDMCEKLSKQNKILKEALEFYSDSYNMYGEVKECDLKEDRGGDITREFGSLAREALKKVEENGN